MPVEGSFVRRGRVRLTNWMYKDAERFAAKRCHVIVSVADAMTREFLERGIGRPEQYVTVRSGMEVGAFLNPVPGETGHRLGFASTDFVVGTVARLAEHKGHDDLLDALAGEMRRDPRIKLLWVGDGWWRERLIAKARSVDLGVAELDRAGSAVDFRNASSRQVILTGLVPPQLIPGLIRGMDVLAHPSYREGLPRTVPQALLCGVCPVAYDCDGTGEVCREMETGRLVPVGDRDGLREAIVWLMNHPREREAMAARGREECRVAFSAETMVAELEKVYARAIELAAHSK
jgi:glycosyltransferase involved in cell wall biosynthesis